VDEQLSLSNVPPASVASVRIRSLLLGFRRNAQNALVFTVDQTKRERFMNRIIMAFALGIACAPGVGLAQDSDTPAPTDTAPPPPSADCTTLDCNTNRNQQDNLNNSSGTPSAPDSLGEDRGTTSGSGTLTPTTPNDSLSGDDNDGGLGSRGSSGGGLSDGDSGL
jgi:hypothetical protein